jgi:hypothetical protein
VTDAALAHLDLDELLDELLVRIRDALREDTGGDGLRLAATLAGRDDLSAQTVEGIRNTLHTQADRMRRLVKQLLDLSRLDAAVIEISPERVALASKTGAGLGLSIVRSYARAHGGDLLYDSTGRQGARFELILPMDRPRGKYLWERRGSTRVPQPTLADAAKDPFRCSRRQHRSEGSGAAASGWGTRIEPCREQAIRGRSTILSVDPARRRRAGSSSRRSSSSLAAARRRSPARSRTAGRRLAADARRGLARTSPGEPTHIPRCVLTARTGPTLASA